MKKNRLVIVLILLVGLFLTGCGSNKDALKFKEEYEALNGKENTQGKEHRKIRISKKNPFIYTTAEEVVEKIENGDSFYVYFGDPLCPWCRSVLEKFISVANDEDILKVYYVKGWDDEGNEILRSRYTLNSSGELEKTVKGTDAYYKLLEHFDSLLGDYTVNNPDGEKVKTGEKRIFFPNFFYIERGKALKMTDGISKWQEDPREKLTKAILEDQEEMFENFFDED